MVHFVGAGPGAPDLITVRGKQYLEEADVVAIKFFRRVLCNTGLSLEVG